MARNKYPEETVKKILNTAISLFLENGYEKTSMQDIVNALGMSKGAIYHHFKSKEELFQRSIPKSKHSESLLPQTGIRFQELKHRLPDK